MYDKPHHALALLVFNTEYVKMDTHFICFCFNLT